MVRKKRYVQTSTKIWSSLELLIGKGKEKTYCVDEVITLNKTSPSHKSSITHRSYLTRTVIARSSKDS